MKNINLTLVQPDIVWEDASANRKKYAEMLSSVEFTDVILLPEMFTTGFSMRSNELKETMDGPSVEWMKNVACQKSAVVAGSLIIRDGKDNYNRFVWVTPDGKTATYDKRHLFSMGEEHRHYSPGKERLILEYKGWRICPLICYDLRFPVWSRNAGDYDLLLYLANFPSPRHAVWKNLLVARAIENQSWCIGVNRVGKDGAGLDYEGDSGWVDPRGNAHFLGAAEGVHQITLSLQELQRFREKFPVLEDRDAFRLL